MPLSRDPQRWLRDPDDPRVLSILRDEAAKTRASLAGIAELEARLSDEIERRCAARDASAVVPWDGYGYYSRQVDDRDYLIHCRKTNDAAVEEVVLDENALAEGRAYCSLRTFEISPDHRYLAYGVDWSGDERLSLWVRDLEDGSIREIQKGVAEHVAWAADSRTLFYTSLDPANRPHRTYRHDVGSTAGDVLVHEESDAAFRLELSRSESGEYLFLIARSPTSTEIRVASARSPDAPFELMRRRQAGIREAITHQGQHFYRLSSSSEGTFELARAPVDRPADWQSVSAPEGTLQMERLVAFAEYLVLFARRDGLRRVWVRPMADASADWFPVPLLDDAAVVVPEENRDFHGSRLRLGFSAMTRPYSVVVFDMESRTSTVEKESPVGGGFDRDDYVSQRLFAVAADGVRIPISLVYRLGCRRSEGNPLVLYAYGAYGYCVEPEFDRARLSLLDRGVIYAMAHVRGGGEMGRAWHDAGKLGEKKNSFDDCIACAEHLVHCGYAVRGRMALMGESAGGLLVAAVLNQRPELFAAVVADCPFVDVVETLSDPSLPLSVGDWQEFGDPREEPMRSYIRSYSPCDNVRQQAYPAIYVTAGLDDPRVAYWEPIRWVARLREKTTARRPIVLDINTESGHWGASGRSGYYRETARKYAFLLQALLPADGRKLESIRISHAGE